MLTCYRLLYINCNDVHLLYQKTNSYVIYRFSNPDNYDAVYVPNGCQAAIEEKYKGSALERNIGFQKLLVMNILNVNKL